MNKVPKLIHITNNHVTRFEVSTDNVIFNHLCRDMKVMTYYVKSLHETKTT